MERTWRAAYGEPLRRLAAALTQAKESRNLGDISFIYECVGTPADLPDLAAAYTKSIEATLTLPFETHQYFRPRGSAYSFRFSTRQLLARGAEVPTAPKTTGEAAIYFIALHDRKDFRPKDWVEQAVRWLGHPTPYMREFVLDHLPQPAPKEVLALVPKLLVDEYVDLQIAACHTAKENPQEALRGPVMAILKKGTEGNLLSAAAEAAEANGVTHDKVMEVWADRIEGDLGGAAVVRLLGVVETGAGGGTRGDLSPDEQKAAKAAWLKFIDAHRAELKAGTRYKPRDPALTPDLFPQGFYYQLDDGRWPDGKAP